MLRYLLTLMIALTSPAIGCAAAPLDAGVSQTLARERAGLIRATRYAIDATIQADATSLRGTLAIGFELERPARVALDYRPAVNGRAGNWRINGVAREPGLVNQHVVLEAGWLRAGANQVSLEFNAPIAAAGAALTRYADPADGLAYVYSLFVPSDASSVFPCFDQPDLKAVWSLALTVPGTWRAVSNGRLAQSREQDGMTRHEFADTRPLPTYLFALAAGPFDALTEAGHASGTTLFVRRSQRARAEREAAYVLRLSRESMAFFARYFDHPQPFDKHDLVLLPEFPFGGMEHAGAVFLREESVLFRAPPTAADRLRRANLILHENSHQWFGNLVTMRWFDDLWLKEGFANYAAAKAVEALLPEFDAWNAQRAAKLAAYRTDVTAGTTAIYQPLDNLANAKSVYGAIVYTKAPAVLRQAEHFLGAEVFERAVRQVVRDHAYGNMAWRDLVAAFERHAGRDLTTWADAWVRRRGMATVRVVRPSVPGQPFTLTQSDALSEGGVWPMRLRLAFIDATGATRQADIRLDGSAVQVAAPQGASPFIVAPNHGDFAYGRFMLDAQSARNALARPDLLRETLTRGLVFDALWEQVRDAELAPEEFLRFTLRVLPAETDAISYAGLLARIASAFRAYLSDAQRERIAPQVEAALLERMVGAPSTGMRLQAMRTLAEMAWTPRGQGALIALLDDRMRVGDSPLAPRDRFGMVQRLLARDHAASAARLAAETARAAGEDTASFAYATGAARADAATKLRYFEQFVGDAALAEDWIEQSLAPFNAVEHAALTAPLLRRALEALPALKRERKIFFVGAWLAAFIGGQDSAAALDEMLRFAALGGLDADLRLKVLEFADGLRRTVRIRARFAADNAGPPPRQ